MGNCYTDYPRGGAQDVRWNPKSQMRSANYYQDLQNNPPQQYQPDYPRRARQASYEVNYTQPQSNQPYHDPFLGQNGANNYQEPHFGQQTTNYQEQNFEYRQREPSNVFEVQPAEFNIQQQGFQEQFQQRNPEQRLTNSQAEALFSGEQNFMETDSTPRNGGGVQSDFHLNGSFQAYQPTKVREERVVSQFDPISYEQTEAPGRSNTRKSANGFNSSALRSASIEKINSFVKLPEPVGSTSPIIAKQSSYRKDANSKPITANSIILAPPPEPDAPKMLAKASKMNEESYAVRTTRQELPLKAYTLRGLAPEEGPFTLSDGGTYFGQRRGNVMEGKGKWIGTEGELYEGYWKDGWWDGEGRFISAEGDIYQGDWHRGKKCGRGLLQMLTGYLYRGDWKDDLPNGKGHEREANGSTYDGEFEKGSRTGEGVFLNKVTGDTYVGHFKDGFYNGQGKLTKADGEEYEGEFVNSKYHGVGNLQDKLGTYSGEFQLGRRHGKGTQTFNQTGDEFTGAWRFGKQDGKGKLIDGRTREVKEGHWKNGIFDNATVRIGKSTLGFQQTTSAFEQNYNY